MNKLEEILCLIRGHQVMHPDHGITCACMDKYIRQLRQLLDVRNGIVFAGDDVVAIQQRVDYVVRSALENRHR